MPDRVLLYIEDDLASQMVMAGALRSLPRLELVCARTGAQGIAIAVERHLELVLLDANLPDMTGPEIVTELAAGEPAPPVLVVSADITSAHVDERLDGGAVGWMAKPVDIDELIETVIRYVH